MNMNTMFGCPLAWTEPSVNIRNNKTDNLKHNIAVTPKRDGIKRYHNPHILNDGVEAMFRFGSKGNEDGFVG